MKSERRHELERNELAEWLLGAYKRFKPYEKLLLGTLAFALVVLLIYTVSARYSSARSAEGWTEFDEAFSLGAGGANYEGIIESYGDTDLGNWAAVIAADAYLGSGCNQLFVNKADAFRDLKRAVEHYMNVLEKSQQPLIRERATFGLARAREAMARDRKDLDRAAEEYEKVFTNWPEGAYAEAARRRYEDLNLKDTTQMYLRFAKYEPKPAFLDEPGTPGERPPFDFDAIPDDAPLFEPSVKLDLDGPASAMPGRGDEPEDGDAEPKETPPEDVPAKETPTEDTPPEDTPPEDTPTEDTPAKDADSDDAAGQDASTPEGPAPEPAPAEPVESTEPGPAPDVPPADAPAPDSDAKEVPAPGADES